jgi:carbon monoxide dehydrogenase subunit G
VTTAFTTSATIDRPAPEVWARLTDWPSAPDWMPGVESLRANGPELTFRARGRDRTAHVEVVEPGRSLVVRSAQGAVTSAYTYTCTPSGAGTDLTLVADLVAGGVWRPFAPLLRAAVRRADSGQPALLKAACERPPARP